MRNLFKFVIGVGCLLVLGLALVGCGGNSDDGEEFELRYIVDGAVYHTLRTQGEEAIVLPEEPEKADFEFKGWFFDLDLWLSELTADSFLDTKLSADVSVYAKWLPVQPEEPEEPDEFADFEFTLIDEGSGYEIKLKEESELTEVVIPSSYKGLPVTRIGTLAFFECADITAIEIPSSVTSIGDFAFAYCEGLTSIEIPSNVRSIGMNAFASSSALVSVFIPISVETIGGAAFYNCESLTIYCEAESQPIGWSEIWNETNCPVVWCYTDEPTK